MTLKKIFQKTIRWAAFGIATCLVLSGLIFGLAQTEKGKEIIAGRLENALNHGGETGVEIGKIEGLIPFNMRLDHLAWGDAGSQWLKLDGVRFRWSPMKLFRGSFFIEELSAGRVQISRPPASKKDREAAPTPLPTWLGIIDRLRIAHFSVEQLVLEQSLFGERAIFKAEATLGASLSESRWESRLRLERTDQISAPTRFDAAFKGEGSRLKVDVHMEDPAGGLAAKVLGIKGPIFLALQGEGLVTAWKGELHARAGQIGEIQAEVGLEIREDFGLTARGNMKLATDIVPLPLRGWMDGSSHIQIGARLSKKKVLTVDQFGLTSKKTSLEMSGAMDLMKETARGRFRLRCDDLSPLETLASIKGTGGLTVEGQFSGPVRQPETTLVFRLGEVSGDGFNVQQVDGNLQLGLLKPLGSHPMGVRLRGQGKLTKVTIKNAETLPEKDFKWAVAVEGPAGERFHADKIELVGKKMSAKFSGWVNTDGTRATVDALMDVPDLSPISDLLDIPMDGGARLKALLTANPKELSLSARFSGKYHPPEVMDPSLVTLLGREVSFAGNVSFDGKNVVKSPDLSLEAVAGTLKGAASYDLAKKSLKGTYQLEVPKLAPFSSILKEDIKGSLSSGGTFENSPKGTNLDVEAAGRRINLKGKTFERLDARLSAAGLPPKSRGRLSLKGIQRGRTFRGNTHFDLEDRRLALSGLSLQGAGAEVNGNLGFDLARNLVEGELTGKSTDLRSLSGLFDQKIEGAAQIRARLSSSKQGQQVAFDMDGVNLVHPMGRLDKAHIQGALTDLFKTPRGKLKLNLEGGEMRELRLASTEIGAEGDLRELHVAVKGKGQYKAETFDVETSGLFAYSSDGQRVVLNRFQGHYGKQPLVLEKGPVIVKRSVGSLSFDPMAIRLAGGCVEGSGKMEKNTLGVSIRFTDLALAALPITGFPDFKGKAGGNIRLSGSPGQPELRAEFRISDLGLRDSQIKDLPPGNLVANASLRQGKLTAEVTLGGITAKPFKADLAFPMNLALSPFSFSLPGSGELRGDVAGEVNLARIGEIMALHDQKLNGRLQLALLLRGQVEAPQISGGGHIREGAYENLRTGTLLSDMDVDIVAENDKIAVKETRFSDGESGKITAQGWLAMIPKKGFPFSVSLTFDKAKPIRHDDATVVVDGTLKLSGSLTDSLLEGRLHIVQGEFRIPERLPPEIVQLDVEEISRSGAGEGEKGTSPRKSAPPPSRHLKLDVAIEAPGRLFVEGRGLTSEWKGDLLARGSVNAPVVTGNLSVVRGHADFLGKRFGLSRGVITLGGAVPPSPLLDVLAEARTKDITARLEISGRIKNPDIKLSSDPTLPSDEILARLLFGRSLSDVTPFQAVQLALAANTLAGGNGIDLMGRTKKILHIDQIEVKNLDGDKDEAAVAAGKYLSETVYLEVEKGLGPKSGKASVEWEPTPNIGIETEVGENAEAGIGINWKWNY